MNGMTWPLQGCAAGWRRLVDISCWCRNLPVLPLHLPWCLPNHQDHRPRRCHTRSQTNPTKAPSSEVRVISRHSRISQNMPQFLRFFFVYDGLRLLINAEHMKSHKWRRAIDRLGFDNVLKVGREAIWPHIATRPKGSPQK